MKKLDLYVFYSNDKLTKKSIDAGATGIVVDWENTTLKKYRQSLYSTQINKHDISTLKSAKEINSDVLICRVNGGDQMRREEIDLAIDNGANEIMVPMIRNEKQIESVLCMINGRAKCIVMIETEDAVRMVYEIDQFPIDKVYVGLNDLAIDRKQKNLFKPFIDGTLDHICENISKELGVAGLTHPGLGSPIPSYLLLNELIRLQCSFTFLRRSFFRDSIKHSPLDIINEIKERHNSNKSHNSEDHQAFKQMIETTKHEFI